jgi:hypothetical protein
MRAAAMTSRVLSIGAILVASLAVGEASDGGDKVRDGKPHPVWTEVKWPFLYDAWGNGRAFHCSAAACGAELGVYIRPKVGFCNCSIGVADDDEIDRVGDVNMIDDNYRPLEPGKPAMIGDMPGRARRFVVEPPAGTRQYAIGMAVSKKCDALVATVVSRAPIDDRLEQLAMAELNASPVVRWASSTVGQE